MKQSGVIIEKIDKNSIELRYDSQIMEGGVELPSLLTIKSEKEMVLTYPNSYKAGIHLPLYLQLIRKAGIKEKRYDFWTVIMKLAEAL